MSEPTTCIKKPDFFSRAETPFGPKCLIDNAPALLAHAEKSLRWLLGERDCYYEGCANRITGQVTDENDREVLASYDRDIDELRALIAEARGES